MRIAMTGSEWFTSRAGGLNRYFESLHQALAAQESAAVSAWAFGDAPESANTWGPTGLGLGRRVLLSSRSLSGADILDQHFALYGPVVRSGAVRVAHFQGPWAGESLLAGQPRFGARLKKSIERARYHTASAAIVLSEPFKRVLVDQYDYPEEQITVIPPGVDLERFSVRLNSELRPVVLCVRRLERRMGIHVLLRAWDAVVAAHPDAELRIVGTGSEEHNLRDQAAAGARPSSVTFTGRVSDASLHDEYAAATLTVVPSIGLEGFGLISLESLASGRAPIVTDCGGLPDGVRALDPTLIVPPGDAEALAQRIYSALNGNRPSSDECRKHAESFSWAVAANRHLALYEELLTD